MSEKKPIGSSSSFTYELFGSNSGHNTSPSSNDIFASLLRPSSSKRSEVGGKTEEFSWQPKTESNSKSSELKSHNTSSREANSFYEEQKAHPCHLSSSIYYGGQDVYPHPHNTQNPATGLNSSIKKDGDEEDDSGGASRGNWWQGSLYY